MPGTADNPNETQAQTGAQGEETTPSANAGSGGQDRVALLESRLAGLEARLTENGRARSQAEKERDEARAKLAEYEQGKIGAEEAFQAELRRERERAEQAERGARLARIEARFPEAYGVLGETAATLTDEQLAAAEARMTGTKATEESEPGNPRTPGARRPAASQPAGGTDSGNEPTLDQMKAQLRGMQSPWA